VSNTDSPQTRYGYNLHAAIFTQIKSFHANKKRPLVAFYFLPVQVLFHPLPGAHGNAALDCMDC
jgi:hypothetical protein